MGIFRETLEICSCLLLVELSVCYALGVLGLVSIHDEISDTLVRKALILAPACAFNSDGSISWSSACNVLTCHVGLTLNYFADVVPFLFSFHVPFSNCSNRI